ncbi:diaminopimelate epimerase, partial [Chromohalobacter sp. HP20-39]|nr:diaminopimelate epimerase [Chromohalobacter sp. HP20-39]
QVDTMNRRLRLALQDDGRVTVDMGAPVFEHAALPFDAHGLTPRRVNGFELWPIDGLELAVLSMGNPHAVQRVDDVQAAPVATQGPQIEGHA